MPSFTPLDIELIFIVFGMLIVAFIVARWGYGFWQDLSDQPGKRTASLMFLFLGLTLYFIIAATNITALISIVPFRDYQPGLRFVHALTVWGLVAVLVLVDRIFTNARKN